MISSTCIVPTVFLSETVRRCFVPKEAKADREWTLFYRSGEFFWEPPSNSVIIILLNYILFFSLPGWWRQSSPLPADDREAVLQACDQRHNDLNQRRIATTVFQQQPGPELAVEWLRAGSPIDLIQLESWLNQRRLAQFSRSFVIRRTHVPDREHSEERSMPWFRLCVGNLMCQRNLCIPNSMWCAFSYHDFLLQWKQPCVPFYDTTSLSVRTDTSGWWRCFVNRFLRQNCFIDHSCPTL